MSFILKNERPDPERFGFFDLIEDVPVVDSH